MALGLVRLKITILLINYAKIEIKLLQIQFSNNSRSKTSNVELWSACHFRQNMPLSAISKILAFQKVFIFAECQKWLFFMFTKSDATLRKQRSFWHYAIFLKLPDGPSFQVSFSDVTVAVSPHRLSKKCIKVRFFEHISERYFWREKAYNSTNNSRSQNRDRRVI